MKRINSQNRDEWLIARSKTIGASQSRILLGYGYANETKLALWYEKRLGLDGVVLDSEDELDDETKMKYELGKDVEPIGLKKVEKWIDKQIALPRDDPNRVICPTVKEKYVASNSFTLYVDGCMSATPDGVVTLIQEGGGVYRGVIEVKNVDKIFAGEWTEDVPPNRYEAQVYHQMAVSDSTFGILIGFIGGQKYRIYYIERADHVIDRIRKVCADFYDDVINDREPEATGADVDKKVLNSLHPDDNGATVELDVDTVERLQAAKRESKELEKEIKELENNVRQEIGDATFGFCDGFELSLKTQERKESVRHIKPSKFRTLRIKEV